MCVGAQNTSRRRRRGGGGYRSTLDLFEDVRLPNFVFQVWNHIWCICQASWIGVVTPWLPAKLCFIGGVVRSFPQQFLRGCLVTLVLLLFSALLISSSNWAHDIAQISAAWVCWLYRCSHVHYVLVSQGGNAPERWHCITAAPNCAVFSLITVSLIF